LSATRVDKPQTDAQSDKKNEISSISRVCVPKEPKNPFRATKEGVSRAIKKLGHFRRTIRDKFFLCFFLSKKTLLGETFMKKIGLYRV
jgi:hypothetical protein